MASSGSKYDESDFRELLSNIGNGNNDEQSEMVRVCITHEFEGKKMHFLVGLTKERYAEYLKVLKENPNLTSSEAWKKMNKK